MTQLEYNDDNNSEFVNNLDKSAFAGYDKYQKGGIIGFMVDKGIVKSEAVAQTILIFIIVICIGFVAFYWTDGFGINKTDPIQSLTEEELQQLPPELRENILKIRNAK